jgi:hypothetical protein
MAKDRSSHLNEVVEAIAFLKNAERDWPGHANSLLKEVLKRTQNDLQDELFMIMSEKRGRKRPEVSKRSGLKKATESS